MNATVQSILTSYPKIPDLPVIELIVSRTLFRWTVGRGGDYGRDLVATAAEILQVKSVVVELFKPNMVTRYHDGRCFPGFLEVLAQGLLTSAGSSVLFK